MKYERPTLVDYGTLAEMTKAITVIGPEDGASKNQNQHHVPGPPSIPAGP